MIILGLTGSIAMGKSETARMFREAGVPVFDADEAVHALYSESGDAVKPISEHFPEAIINGAVDRTELGQIVLNNQEYLKVLESIVHPLVQNQRSNFLQSSERQGQPIVVLDIPLLFETHGESQVDKIVVVSAPAELQRSRALARPGMTEEKLESILAKQMPDSEKRKRADFIVDSSRGLDYARQQVEDIIETVTQSA